MAKKKKARNAATKKSDRKTLLMILGGAFFLRLILSSFGTLSIDLNTFVAWSNRLVEVRLNAFYDSWSDYLPGYLYVLWIVKHISALLHFPDTLLYKLPSLCADIATGYVIFKTLTRLNVKRHIPLLATAAYVFNPAVWGNSTLWGQVDSFTALATLSGLYFLPVKPYRAAVSFALGFLVKPQIAFLTPVLIWYVIRHRWKISHIVSVSGVAFGVIVLGFVPFSSGNLFSFMFERLSATATQYPYTSVNAFNVWALWGFWRSDTTNTQALWGLWKRDTVGLITPQIRGYVLYFITLIGFMLSLSRKYSKKFEPLKLYLATSVAYLANFMFLTRMHERHELPVLAPLAIASAFLPILWIPYTFISLVYSANLLYAHAWVTHAFKEIFSRPIIGLFVLINLLSLIVLLMYQKLPALSDVVRFFSSKKKRIQRQSVAFPKVSLPKRYMKYALWGVLAFSLVTRLIGIGYPEKEYFDEVYHAFTARQLLDGNSDAWEWWHTPPEGYAYEWTHPPFAKYAMMATMSVFGQSPFGWRSAPIIFGMGVTYLIYRVARELFDDEFVGILSAAVWSLDGLALGMSRIGMNDTFLLFWSLLTFLLFYKQKYVVSSLAFGMALSTKWSAVWLGPILAIVLLTQVVSDKKDFWGAVGSRFWKLSSFLIIPITLYFIHYLPFVLTHTWDQSWELQQQMWWYHTRLSATHSYTSQWWSWPFLSRPIYLHVGQGSGDMVRKIYAMGNPMVFWFGVVAAVYAMLHSWKENNQALGITIFSYLAFFVTWAGSPRIMFLYHYLPSLAFLTILIGWFLRRYPRFIVPVFTVFLLSFMYFYPHWTGLPVPQWLDESYYWLPTWQ